MDALSKFEEKHIEAFTQFGIAGLILFVFFMLLLLILRQHSNTVKGVVSRMSEDHKDSNNQWRASFETHSNRADSRQSETNEVLRDLTKVMAEDNAHHRKMQSN